MSTSVEQLRDLDPNDPSRWPLPYRIGAIVLIFVIAVSAMAYFMAWKPKKPELDAARDEFGDADGAHRLNTPICVGGPSSGSTSPIGRNSTE